MSLGFYICIAISLVLVILSIKYPKSKKIFIVWFFWLLILFGFSSNNADYKMYVENYREFGTKIQFGNYFLFKFLCYIFYNLKIPYIIFLLIYSTTGLSMIFSVINRYSRNKNYSIIFYFLMPFVFDVIQLKNFMAFSIIIFALPYLFDLNKKNAFIYMILCAIASLFHPLAVLSFAFLVLQKFDNKKLDKILLIILLIEISLIVSDLFLPMVSILLPSDKFVAYFMNKQYIPGISTTLKSIIIIFIQIIILFICNKYNNKDNMTNNLYKINKFYLLFIPILFYTNQIMRLPRSLIIYIYVCATNVFEKVNFKIKIVLVLLIAMLIFVNLHSDIFSINNTAKTIIPLFNNNIFINFLVDIFI